MRCRVWSDHSRRLQQAAHSRSRGRGYSLRVHGFFAFPSSQGKAFADHERVERINEEFRRRTKKTQASLPGQDGVLLLLFGLMRSGHIKLRALNGRQDLKEVKKAA
jgi:hypothetical protein